MALSVFLASCQDSSNEKQPIEKFQLLLAKAGFTVNPTALAIKNKLVLVLGEKKGVVFYEVGKEQVLSEDQSTKQWLHYDGKTLYVIWWTTNDKKEKFLKLRVSNDDGQTFSPATIINTDLGVLTDISVASNGQGAIAIAYTDERRPGYGVYINYSTDSGKTWAKQDSRLDTPVITSAMKTENNQDIATFANSPKLSYLENKLIAVWQQVDMTEMGQSMLRIVTKASNDNGKTWGAESNIFTAPNMQPVEFQTFENDKKIYIFAMLTGDTQAKGFTGFYNTDPTFNQWTEINNAELGSDLSKKTTSWFNGAFSGENLILTFTAKPMDGTGMVHAMSAVLSTTNNQWLGKAKQLDADKGHELTKSTFPYVIDAGDAGVMVVWEDYRSIVPTIYSDISKDHGKTWLTSAKPLTTPGLSVAKDPKLFSSQDKLWLTYFMVKLDGTNPSGTRVYQEFMKGSDGQLQLPDIKVAMPDAEKLRERLIERANKFWALREERKWEETWDYMEPVYRERFDKAQWMAQQGKLSFSKTVVDETSIDIKGNLAFLIANVEVSVNQQVSQEGLLESAPPNQQKVDMKWGWFYDDWYFMPSIVFGDHLEYDR